MIRKQQEIAIARPLDSFSTTIPNTSSIFEYLEDTKEYANLCGPTNKGYISYNSRTKCTLIADTNSNLDLLYELAIGSKSIVSGTTTYTTAINHDLIKVLENSPEQSYEHYDVGIGNLQLVYNTNGIATTTATLYGNSILAGTPSILPDAPINSNITKEFTISITGITGNITDVTIEIENTYNNYTCMSGEFIGSQMVDKVVTGSFTLDTPLKTLSTGTLSISSISHGITCIIDIQSLKEVVVDSIVYTKAEFRVPDSNISMYFT